MAPVRILFVEDEASISDPFSRALSREGFEPVVARTAREALALAERSEFALVLLDLNLPDGDGRDVARELRRRGDTPILMLTARGTETDRIVGLDPLRQRQRLAAGARHHRLEPLARERLRERVRDRGLVLDEEDPRRHPPAL